jgi:hypothetical protein
MKIVQLMFIRRSAMMWFSGLCSSLEKIDEKVLAVQQNDMSIPLCIQSFDTCDDFPSTRLTRDLTLHPTSAYSLAAADSDFANSAAAHSPY